MSGESLFEELDRLGVEVWTDGINLQVRGSGEPLPPAVCEALREQKEKMILSGPFLLPDFEQAAARCYRAMLDRGYSQRRAKCALLRFVPRNDTEAANNLLEAVTAGGNLDAAAVIRWFRYAQRTERLPIEPFDLAPGRRVEDPSGFYAALNESIEAGPEGPWGEAILDDLRLLAVVTHRKDSVIL